jgi:hypothetical protein
VRVTFAAPACIVTAAEVAILRLLIVLLQHLLLLLLVQPSRCCTCGDAACCVSHGSQSCSCHSRHILQQQETAATLLSSCRGWGLGASGAINVFARQGPVPLCGQKPALTTVTRYHCS